MRRRPKFDPVRTSSPAKHISFDQPGVFQRLSLDSYNDRILGGSYAAAEFIGLIGTAGLSFARPGYAQTNVGLPLVIKAFRFDQLQAV